MTAIVAVKKADCVHLLSDRAFYTEGTGVVHGFADKVYQIRPGLNGVYAVNGPAAGFVHFERAMKVLQPRSFDELLFNFDEFLRFYRTAMSSVSEPSRLLLAGWFATADEPALIGISNFEAPAMPAWTPVQLDCFSGRDAAALHPVACFTPDVGVDLIRAMRAEPTQDVDAKGRPISEPGCRVGGGIDHTMITRDAEPTFERLHDWPEDVVGAPLAA